MIPEPRSQCTRGPEVGFWVLTDIAIGLVSVWLAFKLAPYAPALTAAARKHIDMGTAAMIFAAFLCIVSNVVGMQSPLLQRFGSRLMVRGLGVSMTALVLLGSITFGALYQTLGRWILLQIGIYSFGGLLGSRLLFWFITEQRAMRVALLGSGEQEQLLRRLAERYRSVVKIVKRLDAEAVRRLTRREGAQESVDWCEFSEEMDRLGADAVVDGLDLRNDDVTIGCLIDCLAHGIPVSSYASFVERNFLLVPASEIRGDWFIQADLQVGHPINESLKRFADVVVGLCGLLLASPVLIVAALCIRVESPGPALYSQIRVGQFGRRFRIWKLRSMRQDAEENGVQWATRNDERITVLGRILRKTRLDELPQFWNVLRGDMSCVGPRPERPEFVSTLRAAIPYFEQRHLVKPGLTGWAQINYGYGASVEDAREKLNLDLYYVKYRSMTLDLQILLRTVGVIMKGSR